MSYINTAGKYFTDKLNTFSDNVSVARNKFYSNFKRRYSIVNVSRRTSSFPIRDQKSFCTTRQRRPDGDHDRIRHLFTTILGLMGGPCRVCSSFYTTLGGVSMHKPVIGCKGIINIICCKMYYCRFHITGVTIYLSVVAKWNCRRQTFGTQSTCRRTLRFYTCILYCR